MKMRRVILWAVVAGSAVVGAWAYRADAEVRRGEKAFQDAQCGSCHLSGGAPSLQNVSKRLDKKKLKQFISDPDSVYRQRGMQSLNIGYPRMPKPGAKPDDVDAIVSYLQTLRD
jgi:mono/diheme cytochrome c family protein